MLEFQHYDPIVPTVDEARESPVAGKLSGPEELVSRLLELPSGRLALAEVMVEPIRIALTHHAMRDFE